MYDDRIIAFIFSNAFLFSVLFGGLGGIVQAIDLQYQLEIKDLLKRLIIGSVVGAFMFLLVHDIERLTPAVRLVNSFVAGFSGSFLVRRYSKMIFGHPITNPIPLVSDKKKEEDDSHGHC